MSPSNQLQKMLLETQLNKLAEKNITPKDITPTDYLWMIKRIKRLEEAFTRIVDIYHRYEFKDPGLLDAMPIIRQVMAYDEDWPPADRPIDRDGWNQTMHLLEHKLGIALKALRFYAERESNPKKWGNLVTKTAITAIDEIEAMR